AMALVNSLRDMMFSPMSVSLPQRSGTGRVRRISAQPASPASAASRPGNGFGLVGDAAGSRTNRKSGGQFWTPIPRLRGSLFHAETHDVDRREHPHQVVGHQLLSPPGIAAGDRLDDRD